MFLIKLDADGNLVWKRHFDGIDDYVSVLPKTISVNEIGHLFLSGEHSNGYLDANPNDDGEVYLFSYTHAPLFFVCFFPALTGVPWLV